MFVPLIAEGLANSVDLRTTWTLDHVYDSVEALALTQENERCALDVATTISRR